MFECAVVTSQSDDKGPFAADISQDVINEALKSVERREKGANDAAAAATVPPAGASTAELDAIKAELELSQARGREMMQKLKDEHEKMLRAAADLENFKRRAQKEKEEMQKFGNERLLKDFLPVYDNFDRALEHAKSPEDFDSLKKGVEMIRRLFEDTLGKHNVKAFTSKGQPFDPTRHEAMTAADTDEFPPNYVCAEVLKGFLLNERLVRPALVVVSRAKETAPAPAPTEPVPPAGGSAS